MFNNREIIFAFIAAPLLALVTIVLSAVPRRRQRAAPPWGPALAIGGALAAAYCGAGGPRAGAGSPAAARRVGRGGGAGADQRPHAGAGQSRRGRRAGDRRRWPAGLLASQPLAVAGRRVGAGGRDHGTQPLRPLPGR